MAKSVMRVKAIPIAASDDTYKRLLDKWIETHYHIWIFHREGVKAWNDKCALYIERDITLINVGQILVADGHILNFEILNPWTGKPKRMMLVLWYDMRSNFPLGWEISPTESSQAIASALRRAIMRLGKYPEVVYLDNGKAFASKFFNGMDFEQCGFRGIFAKLGIGTIFAWSYHPQSKPIERFFKTFSELERWVPTYTGTSIESQPPRMRRNEKLHRKVYEKITGGECITLEQAHSAIARWFDDYVRRDQEGHLKGYSPLEVFEEGRGPGIDQAILNFLMMSEDQKNIRRNGIKLFGKDYYHPNLYGRKHKVKIYYDLQNLDSILVDSFI